MFILGCRADVERSGGVDEDMRSFQNSHHIRLGCLFAVPCGFQHLEENLMCDVGVTTFLDFEEGLVEGWLGFDVEVVHTIDSRLPPDPLSCPPPPLLGHGFDVSDVCTGFHFLEGLF